MIFEKVKEVIVDTLNISQEKVTLDAKLGDDLGADSLDAVELNIALEEAFSITISDEYLLTFKEVKDIVNYIESKIK